MPTIAKKDLPAVDDVPTAKPLVEKLTKRKASLEKAAAGATKDGALVAHDPKYRKAKKQVKRAQRRLRSELVRVHVRRKPAAPAAES